MASRIGDGLGGASGSQRGRCLCVRECRQPGDAVLSFRLFCCASEPWMHRGRSVESGRRSPPGLLPVCCSACARKKSRGSGCCSISAGFLSSAPASSRRQQYAIVVFAGLAAMGVYARSCAICRRLRPPRHHSRRCPPKGLLMLRALGDYGSLMLFPAKLFMERQVFAAPGLANPEDASVYFALGVAGVMMIVGAHRRGALARTRTNAPARGCGRGSRSGFCRCRTCFPSTPASRSTGFTCPASGSCFFWQVSCVGPAAAFPGTRLPWPALAIVDRTARHTHLVPHI